jgi:hypothetical protein
VVSDVILLILQVEKPQARFIVAFIAILIVVLAIFAIVVAIASQRPHPNI